MLLKIFSFQLNIYLHRLGLVIKMDNSLIKLNEDYKMTYDYVIKNYDLDIDIKSSTMLGVFSITSFNLLNSSLLNLPKT